MKDKPAWLRPHGTPWKRGTERVVFENPWIRVTEHAAVAPTGRPATYGVVGFKNFAIAVLPIHDDGTVILVGQNRFALADYSWEVPEGGSPLGEDPLAGARRELAEETGLRAERWSAIGAVNGADSLTNHVDHVFLAQGLTQGEAAREGGEADMALCWLSFEQALELVWSGQIRHAGSAYALLAFGQRRQPPSWS